jgi:hypothetical protein
MNLPAIDKAFSEMIHEKGIDEKLGVDRNYVYQLRNKLKKDIGISLETKMDLLKRSGWKESDAKFTREDLIDLTKFIIRSSAKAKEFGPEYLVEKWIAAKK